VARKWGHWYSGFDSGDLFDLSYDPLAATLISHMTLVTQSDLLLI